MIYLIETLIAIVTIIIALIIFETKHKKGFFKFLGLLIFLYIVIFGVSFIFERPQMDIQDIQIVEVNSKEALNKPITYYHFKEITDNVKIEGIIDYQKIGIYEVQYEVNTIFNKYSKNGKIQIVDSKKPEIILTGEIDYKQSYKNEFVDPGYKAVDEYEGDLTQNVKIYKKDIDDLNFNIIYEVQDSSGNKEQKIRKVTIIDDIPPVINLNGSSNMTLLINDKYEEKGAKSIDEKDGDLTDKIETVGKVDTSKEGKYVITYKSTDSQGNTTTKERTVIVKKEIKQTQSSIGNGNKVIYLTFDDGPSSYTNTLLDILKKYNVKATFFVTGNGSDSVIKREYDEGHTVALHTNSHDYSYVYRSRDNFFKDLYAVQSRVERITGKKSYIMRFPGGSSNAVSKSYDGGTKIMSYLTKEVLNRGFRYFDWNVSSGDAGGTTTSDGVYHNVVSTLKSGSSVVLQHDTKKFSIDAVSRIIEYGLENGYTFSRITENTSMVTHRVNN